MKSYTLTVHYNLDKSETIQISADNIESARKIALAAIESKSCLAYSIRESGNCQRF